MLFDLTADQEFLRDTTARFLADRVPTGTLRQLRDDPAGYDHEYWRRGAALGWVSLLVDEDHGGGSITDRPLVDASLLAFEFGRHAAPGPFLPCNVVAGALGASPTVAGAGLLAGLLDGTAVAGWAYAEGHPAGHLPAALELEIRIDGVEAVVHGTKRPVESAAQAGHLLVTGRTGDGLTQVLVPADAPGVSVVPMQSMDLTRRFAKVTFDQVRVPAAHVLGEPGGAGAQVARQLRQALVLTCAESVGALQTGFDLTTEWAFDRYSFGRPLASYQALKHRFADMKTWLEASHAIADAAAVAVADDAPDADELVSVAKAFVGDYGAELLHDCVQLHGGIGVTFEHDLHLYLRRVTLDRALLGTPADHRRLVTDILERREAAA
ncbi:MAG TPA: acyl-CoA dehydrogenase family protein [Acidimicrobiales bacterium]|nr:acyl-CoA dehydrogenase family protein [Acidimicrobiales bacterium]